MPAPSPAGAGTVAATGLLLLVAAAQLCAAQPAWDGVVTTELSWNTYCSSTLATDVETHVELLPGGDFCRTANFSFRHSSDATAFYRTTITCASPDGSGLTGIFTSSRNCTDATCAVCSDAPAYIARHSWADWADRIAHDTCHETDMLLGDAAAADVLDWDAASVDYFKWGGPDMDSYVAFQSENSCIQAGGSWAGTITSLNYADASCSAADPLEETETYMRLLESGAFCTNSIYGNTTSYHKTFVSCSAPDGSLDNPGVYLSSYNCSDAACSVCSDDAEGPNSDEPAYLSRYTWDTWADAMNGDTCHAVDLLVVDANTAAVEYPDFDTSATTLYYTVAGDVESYFGFLNDNSCVHDNRPVAIWNGEVTDVVYSTSDCSDADPVALSTTTVAQALSDGSFCDDAVKAGPGGGDDVRVFNKFTVSCVGAGEGLSRHGSRSSEGVHLRGTNCTSTHDCSVPDDRGYWSQHMSWDDFLFTMQDFESGLCSEAPGADDDDDDQTYYYVATGDVAPYFDFLANNSCIREKLDAMVWEGRATDTLYLDAFCASAPLITDTETRIERLPGGDLCRTANVSAFGRTYHTYTRTATSCASPDGSGLTGIFGTSRNCTDATCSECADSPQYVTRYSWADWANLQDTHANTCHEIDVLTGADAAADVLDWSKSYVDYYHWGSAADDEDTDGYIAFLKDQTCIGENADWRGEYSVSLYYDEASCAAASPAMSYTEERLHMLDDGAFCMRGVFNGTLAYAKQVYSCAPPAGVSSATPGVFVSGYICGASDSACGDCADGAGADAPPSFLTRYSWDTWADAMAGDTCHALDFVWVNATEVPTASDLSVDFDADSTRFYHTTGGDLEAVYGFLNDNTCIHSNRPVATWSGTMTTDDYAQPGCTGTPRMSMVSTSLQALSDGSFCGADADASDTMQMRGFSHFSVLCVEPDAYWLSWMPAGVHLVGTNCSSPNDCSVDDDRGSWNFHYSWEDWEAAAGSSADTCHAVNVTTEGSGAGLDDLGMDWYTVGGDSVSYFAFIQQHSCVDAHYAPPAPPEPTPPAQATQNTTIDVGEMVGIAVAFVLIIVVIVVVVVVAKKKSTQRNTANAAAAKYAVRGAENTNPVTAVTHTQAADQDGGSDGGDSDGDWGEGEARI